MLTSRSLTYANLVESFDSDTKNRQRSEDTRGEARLHKANQRWKDSILSLPRRWLGNTQGYTKDNGEELLYSELPKLPLPPLQQTLDTYLQYAEVLITPQKLEQTKAIVKAFGAPNGPGPKLQTCLEIRREETDNWALQWWQEDMYLGIRNPLPIHSNPACLLPKRVFNTANDVANTAAVVVDEIISFKETLDRNELPVERATSREKGQPLCMSQYYHIFGTCRIPELGKDRIESSYQAGENNEEELVVVACRNHFYIIPVKAADRDRLSLEELRTQFLHILTDATTASSAIPVGILTTDNRDAWAKARDVLANDDSNRRNLELISRALCLICLDDGLRKPANLDEHKRAHQILHGGGSKLYTANRWFDKSMQIIISTDGNFGGCFEHSAFDGVVVSYVMEQLCTRLAAPAQEQHAPPTLLPPPERMAWNLDEKVDRAIRQATIRIDRYIEDLDWKWFDFKGYGRDFMKSCKVSPDVYIQLALQYTYYKMYGHLVSTYESAALRRFKLGRIDNIRSAHPQALSWATAMCQAESPCVGVDDEEQLLGNKKVTFNLYGRKLELFEEAARKQTEVMVANILGQGMDNHLLGLRETARELNPNKLPELFTDETYKHAIDFKLSTSQMISRTDGINTGYGPVVPDGYGVCYNPQKDHVVFSIASYFSSDVTNSEAFRSTLEEALESMRVMFEYSKKFTGDKQEK